MALKSTKYFQSVAKKLRNATAVSAICLSLFIPFSSFAKEGSNALLNGIFQSPLEISPLTGATQDPSDIHNGRTNLGIASILKIIKKKLGSLYVDMEIEGSSIVMNADIVSVDYSNVVKKLHPSFKISFDYRYGHDARLPKNFFDGAGTIGSSSNSATLNMSLNFF